MKARAAIFDQLGDSSVIALRQVEVPEPGPGEIRIAVSAFGLNRSEAMFRQGWHPTKPVLPSRIGYEAAGRVESVGPGVTGFKVGDAVSTLPVMSINERGAYGEMFTVPASLARHNPPELSMMEAAALWSSYMTAYGGLVDLVTIRPGDFVLITAASSSVGPPAIQIVNMLGAKAIATTRQRDKADAVRAMGAHDVIVTDEEDIIARVNEITGGKGLQCVFDPIGGPLVAKLAEVTAPYGAIVIYGVLDFETGPLPVQALVQKNLSIHGYAMYLEDRPERNEQAIAFIRKGVAEGKLKPLLGRSFTLDQLVEACSYFDSMRHIGKVVVTVD